MGRKNKKKVNKANATFAQLLQPGLAHYLTSDSAWFMYDDEVFGTSERIPTASETMTALFGTEQERARWHARELDSNNDVFQFFVPDEFWKLNLLSYDSQNAIKMRAFIKERGCSGMYQGADENPLISDPSKRGVLLFFPDKQSYIDFLTTFPELLR